ncbi:MAG: phosphotransferase, partial [Planctomycetota bacterium]
LARIRPELPAAAVRRTSERLSSEAETPDRVVTHGDLGPEHILVDPATHAVTGVIDWEDVGPWEAAGDFVGLWAELGEPALQAALDAYGPAFDERLAGRVRFHATRWMLHQVKTSEDGWKPGDRDRWIARIVERSER